MKKPCSNVLNIEYSKSYEMEADKKAWELLIIPLRLKEGVWQIMSGHKISMN